MAAVTIADSTSEIFDCNVEPRNALPHPDSPDNGTIYPLRERLLARYRNV